MGHTKIAVLTFLFCTSIIKGSSSYLGCYLNFESADQSYYNASYISSTECIEFCVRHNYTWASLSIKTVGVLSWRIRRVTCSCNSKPAITKIDDNLCNTTCPGNPDEFCGGQNESFYSMYSIKTLDQHTEDTEGTNIEMIGGIVTGIIVVVVIIILVVIISYKRRHLRHDFDQVSSEPLDKEANEQTFKLNKYEIGRTRRNTKPNSYSDHEHGHQGTGCTEQKSDTNKVKVENEDKKRKQTDIDCKNDNLTSHDYIPMNPTEMSESSGCADTIEVYENCTQPTHLVYENSTDSNSKEYENRTQPNILEYEITTAYADTRHMYLPLDSLAKEDNDAESDEDGYEYEYMMPKQNVKK